MATMRLIPSAYTLSNTTYLQISDDSNMYTNTDSTTYAQITHNRNSTTAYYLYIHGFNFNDIPSSAEVSSFTVKIRALESGLSTNSSYRMSLYNSGVGISNTTVSASLSTTATTFTFPNGSLTWNTLKDYGNNFRIRVPLRRNVQNTSGYVRVYGAEIEVNYTLSVYHTITASGDGELNPSGSTTLLEGEDYTLNISGLSAKPTVTDNGIDVTSQLTESTSATSILIPNNSTITTFTTSTIQNAYSDADSDTYADLQLSGGSQGTIYLDLTDVSIPSGATIIDVSCEVTLQFNAGGSTSSCSSSFQMYSGTTAKGSSSTWVSSGANVAKNTYTPNIGSWTASEINNARFYLTATNGARSTARHVYIYGVSFSVTYESDGITYIYAINNVTGDHTIIVVAGVSNKLYFKNNGSWVTAVKAYKKVNGSWVEQSDLTTVFDSSTNYVRGN